jgi:RND family efflux transporter MFP subunit
MSKPRPQGFVRVIVIAAIVLVVGALAAAAYWFSRPGVTVTRVIEGPVVQAFYATGTVRPRLEYPISSSVGGLVTQVLVSQGQAVRKDQPLAILSDPNLQAEADKARANLQTRLEFADPKTSPILMQFDRQISAAEGMLQVAQQQEERFTTLSEKNAASANDRDSSIEHKKKIWGDLESLKAQRLAKLRELQQDVETAQAVDRAAREILARQTTRSPIDGVVLDQPIAQGTRVEINGHMMQLADVSVQSLIVRAAVDEENIAAVETGQPVKMALYSFPGRIFDGLVEQRYPKADAARRTFDVDVKFVSPDPRLQPGMTGELAFIQQTRDNALIVPAQAVQQNAVWTIHSGRLAKASAEIGIRSVERAQITRGLNAGDLVIVSPLTGLNEGDRVRITSNLDPKTASDLNKPSTTAVFKGFQ